MKRKQQEGATVARLTTRDWREIYYALESKVRALKEGSLGDEIEPRQDAKWIAHLLRIMRKIGPDGVLASQGT